MYIVFCSEDIGYKFAIELRSRRKTCLGPDFQGGDTPDFRHAFSNRTHLRACGRFWLTSVQRARRVADEKRR